MKTNEIIDTELEIWVVAYPKEARLLERFANKIKLEISLQCHEIKLKIDNGRWSANINNQKMKEAKK